MNNNVTLEQIDKVIERFPNISYAEAKEALDGIDILFVPIGGDGVLDAALAHKVAVQFEPKIIIPSHYAAPSGEEKDSVGNANSLKIFLKEAGEENLKPVDKLTIKRKDLEGKEGDVIVLDVV